MSKELKQEWIERQIEKSKNPEKWAKFYKNHYSDVIKIDKYLLPIEKSTIKRTFCYGCGMYDTATEEEMENAHRQCDRAKSDTNYFITENLTDINMSINKLKYFLIADHKEKEQFRLKNNLPYYIQFTKPFIVRNSELFEGFYSFFKEEEESYYKDKKELTVEEIQLIINALEEEKTRFTKRLNTYLKKYGLSKIDTWTYIRD